MVSLTKVALPTLWGTVVVYLPKEKMEFPSSQGVAQFVFTNDVKIILSELCAVAKCKFHRKIAVATIHLNIIENSILHFSKIAKENIFSKSATFLNNEVVQSIDALLNIASSDAVKIIEQAKCLLVLFIAKYSEAND